MTVLPIHHAYCLSMDILKGTSLGAVICINDSLMRVAKNIKLFKPEMILMVPLMIETMAKKLEEASLLRPRLSKVRCSENSSTQSAAAALIWIRNISICLKNMTLLSSRVTE